MAGLRAATLEGRPCGAGGPAERSGGGHQRRGTAAEGAQRGGRADRGGWGFWRAPARPWWALEAWQNWRGVLVTYKMV